MNSQPKYKKLIEINQKKKLASEPLISKGSNKKKLLKIKSPFITPLDKKDSLSKNQFAMGLIIKAPATLKIILKSLAREIEWEDYIESCIDSIVVFHDEMIKNHSIVEGTARFNSIRNYSILLLEGQNVEPLERVAVGKVDR
jgi:hypothetical protein